MFVSGCAAGFVVPAAAAGSCRVNAFVAGAEAQDKKTESVNGCLRACLFLDASASARYLLGAFVCEQRAEYV